MLNIPACALQLAALYHCRRWLEDGRRSQLVLAAALGLSALLCYQGACVLMLVVGGWIVVSGRWSRLLNRRTLVVALAAGLPAAACLLVWLSFTPEQGRWLIHTPHLGYLGTWLWYPIKMPGLFGPLVLTLAALGAALGVFRRRWRDELLMSGTWIVITYLFHSYLYGKDERYIIALAIPLLALSAVGVWSLVQTLGNHLGGQWARVCRFAAPAALIAVQALFAWHVSVPDVRGFDVIVDTIRNAQKEDQESILVDIGGVDAALFVSQVMLDDPQFRLRVLLFEWLEEYAGIKESKIAGNGVSERQAMETLLDYSGCRWIVAPIRDRPKASRHVPTASGDPATLEIPLDREFRGRGTGPGRPGALSPEQSDWGLDRTQGTLGIEVLENGLDYSAAGDVPNECKPPRQSAERFHRDQGIAERSSDGGPAKSEGMSVTASEGTTFSARRGPGRNRPVSVSGSRRMAWTPVGSGLKWR